ncbi:MAG: ABC transporter permease [Candidatus Pristimantibacillus sp.]
MTFRSLALSNIRGKWQSYSAFFLSSVFSVMIFYIYAAFIYHPDVINGHIKAAMQVRTGMQFCLYLIVIFSFLFVLYSNSSFLKTRKQEFGLFSLFGMTRSQLRKLVVYESVAIALLSIGTGIGLGMLFSKFFFMALAVMLNVADPIPFATPLKAVGITGIGFFVLFVSIAVLTSMRIGKSEIVDLLKAGRKPKGELVFSPWLVALSAICLAAGYGMALAMNVGNFLFIALPVLITVTVGTYFFFTQLSVVTIRFLQKRKSIFYNRTNMLILSQLGYKLKDNARILFMVSIMSAVILTASGTFYLMQVGIKQNMTLYQPYTIAVFERGLHSHEVIDPDKMAESLKRDGHPIAKQEKMIGAEIDKATVVYQQDNNSNYGPAKGIIISASTYNRGAAQLGLSPLIVEQDKVVLETSSNSMPIAVKGVVNGKPIELAVSNTVESAVMNYTNSYYETIIMDDFAYTKLMSSIPEEKQLVAYGYELTKWEHSAAAVANVAALVPNDLKDQADMHRAERYQEYQTSSSLTLFIGMFISLLFFIASGSLIYFKLFTELQEDQAQFRALKRIGMTREEIRKITVSQIGIIFYIPCIVGTIHALVAMKALDQILMSSVWIYSFVVIGIYIVMQTIYFLVASISYLKSMNRGAAS